MLTDFFPNLAQAYAVALERKHRIVVAGWIGGNFGLVRYNRDGGLDPLFGSAGVVLTHFGGSSFSQALDVAIERNGQIIAVGRTDSTGDDDFALARYLAR